MYVYIMYVVSCNHILTEAYIINTVDKNNQHPFETIMLYLDTFL